MDQLSQRSADIRRLRRLLLQEFVFGGIVDAPIKSLVMPPQAQKGYEPRDLRLPLCLAHHILTSRLASSGSTPRLAEAVLVCAQAILRGWLLIPTVSYRAGDPPARAGRARNGRRSRASRVPTPGGRTAGAGRAASRRRAACASTDPA